MSETIMLLEDKHSKAAAKNCNIQDLMKRQESYAECIRSFNLQVSPSGYYWQIGVIEKTQGWILHLSVIRSQFSELFSSIIPLLSAENIPFKIPRNLDTLVSLNDGNLGYINIGKIICIYPESDALASSLAKVLTQAAAGFRGPKVPTDRHLGGIVYTRYGSFNPMLVKDQKGIAVRHIYNPTGVLVPDPYHIPFRLTEGIDWPFGELAQPVPPPRQKLLNFTYYPVQVLKPDAKGRVIKALYFKKFYQIKTCIVKEGKKNMFCDEFGRDIQDRLKWQYDLHQALQDYIPIPKIVGYFHEQDNDYLVMDYINGISLIQWIEKIYRDRLWQDLDKQDKLATIDKFIEILDIIGKLHETKYVHRDITPENILITKKGKLFLIDLELSWSSESGYPYPPFQLGTPGFMSPEQEKTSTPSVKEDIYALGAMLTFFLTNLLPHKLAAFNNGSVRPVLRFFTGESEISAQVSSCLEEDPDRRPTLPAFETNIKLYRQTLNAAVPGSNPPLNTPIVNRKELDDMIRMALNGMGSDDLLTETKCWLSRKFTQEDHIGNRQIEMTLYPGWHTGMGGPLWLIYKASQAGYPIDNFEQPILNSWDYIQERIFNPDSDIPLSLYHGRCGIALIISEGLKSGLIETNEGLIGELYKCFQTPAPLGGLSYGIAGQGLALLACSSWLDPSRVKTLLKSYRDILIDAQSPEGVWQIFQGNDSHDIILGLSKGVAGIIWFLLAAQRHSPEPRAEAPIRNTLKWLKRTRRKDGKNIGWPVALKEKEIDKTSISYGTPGIVLTFLKAYEVFKDETYKTVVEDYLNTLPAATLSQDFSLENGLAGLGELYLEAARQFDEQRWLDRASRIAMFFKVSMQFKDDKQGYWVMDTPKNITADLFTGMGGVIHFLLRLAKKEKSHPLWPETISK